MNIWKVILATMVIFGAGVVAGIMVQRASDAYSPPPRPLDARYSNPWQMRNRELLRRMDRELGLTPEQHGRIEKIMTTSQDRTRSLWDPIAKEMGKETLNVCEEIRSELTPEQRVKFDTISRPHSDRGGERGKRRGTTSPAATNAP